MNKHNSSPSESTSPDAVSRRNFLKTGGLGLAAVGGLSAFPMVSARNLSGRVAGGRARNIIFLVSDGMSAGTFALADQFIRWKEDRLSYWGELSRQRWIRYSLMETASKDSLVTDSAAAASAWGCGQRVKNGSVNMTEDERSLKPILAIARDAGKATGLVTTAMVNHATPAGFGANVMSRGMPRDILDQYLSRDYDLLLGGGRRYFEEYRGHPPAFPAVEAGGYEFVDSRRALLDSGKKDPRLIGIFADVHLPYEVDRLHSGEGLDETVPSLAEMTQAALRRLDSHPNGFLVQIEGARVDHAAHRNDTGGLLFDQLAFDDAIKVVLDFVAGRDDTLVIITTDHGNASPGMSSGGGLGDRNFRRINRIRGSLPALVARLNPDQSTDEVRNHFSEVVGRRIRSEHADLVLKHLQDEYRLPYRRLHRHESLIGQVMANYNDFNWVSGSHTAEYVLLNAFGPGSELIQPFILNTDLFDVMVQAAGMEAWVS